MPSPPPPSGLSSGVNVATELPVLPGHYRRTVWYFVRGWLGMVAGIALFVLGLHVESLVVQILGGVAGFIAFIFMISTIGRAQAAPCPHCSSRMVQGWDAKRQESDGIFVCPGCQGRWRTEAKWGME